MTKPGRKRLVSQEEYWEIYHERERDLEQMPGGAQGAHPDMSDVVTQEELEEEAEIKRQRGSNG